MIRQPATPNPPTRNPQLFMKPNPKKRIETNASSTRLTRLEHAFPEMDLPKSSSQTCSDEQSEAQLWKLGRVVLRRETAHRGGKTVIVVDQFATHLPISIIETVAKKIRISCGCGGAVRGRTIEIQGDQPARVRAVLEREGFKVGGV
jgi:translation initiation factor 1